MKNGMEVKVWLKHMVVLGVYLTSALLFFNGSASFGAGLFSTTDLTGTWRGHSLYSSDTGWEGWDRNIMTVDGSGNFTSNWTDSDQDSGTTSGTMSIDANGILSAMTDTSIEGIMRPDKHLFVMTGLYADPGNDPFLMVGVKQTGASFTAADLAGNWKAYSLHSSAQGWEGWDRIDFNIDNSGNFTAGWTDSDQDSGTDSGTLSINSNGVITLSGVPSLEGVMSPEKDVFVMTGEYAVAGSDPFLMIAVKQTNTAFNLSDLTGEWKIHTIYSSASGWEGWERADLTVDGAGNFTAGWTDSGQDSGSGTGTLAMNSSGIITRGDAVALEGIMSFGKDFFIVSDSYDEPQLSVCVARASSGSGAYSLYYPHISTRSPWQTEIALINTSANQASDGVLQGYSNSGQLIEIKNVYLAAHGRRQITIANEFVRHSEIGYIIYVSDTTGVQGYTKFYQNGKYRTAIPAVDEVNTSTVYITHIASNDMFWTGLSLVNTTGAAKNLTINFNDGRSVVYPINAHEHKIFTIGGLFGGQPQTAIKSGEITNANGIIGLELFGNSSQLDGLLLTDDTVSTIYYPHVADMNVWWTGIVAYNPSAMGCNITISPYTAGGTALATATQPIGGKEKYIGVVKNLGLDSQTAWFKVQSSSALSGFELFGTLNGKLLAAYAEGSGGGAKQGVFPKIEKTGWTGIAFVNTEAGTAAVTLTAYNDNGTAVAVSGLNVGGYAKVVNMVESIFAPQNINSATYVAFTSDKNVVGFQLNGSTDGLMLDGLPTLK